MLHLKLLKDIRVKDFTRVICMFALIRTNSKSLCIKLGDVDGFVVSEARLTVRAYASN